MTASSAVSLIRRESQPWYKVGWVWLVIAIPAASVLLSLVAIWIASQSYDGTVADDYYKRGLQINRELARDRAARRRGLLASVQLAMDERRLLITPTGPNAEDWPARIQVELIHHTRAGQDRTFVLERDHRGAYRGAMPRVAPGVWTVRLSAEDWRLQNSSRLDDDIELVLRPAESNR